MKRLSKLNPWAKRNPSEQELRAALKLAAKVSPRIAEMMLAKQTDAPVKVRPSS